MLDVNAKFNIPLKNDWNVFIYVYEGSIMLDKHDTKQNLAVLSITGDLEISTTNNSAKLILVGGQPINEPVARGGPFVMNSKQEVSQAFYDYQNGLLDK